MSMSSHLNVHDRGRISPLLLLLALLLILALPATAQDVSNIQITRNSQGNFVVTWVLGQNVGGVVVQYRQRASDSWVDQVIVSAPATSFTAPGTSNWTGFQASLSPGISGPTNFGAPVTWVASDAEGGIILSPPQMTATAVKASKLEAKMTQRAISPSTGEMVNRAGYLVSSGNSLRGATEFQVITGAGIGSQALLDAGYWQGIDVWGDVSAGATVCFPGNGQLIFLDASTSPRTQTQISYYSWNGYTCATINTPGSVLFRYTNEPAATVTPAGGAAMANCLVTTTHTLHLRARPGGTIIGYVVMGMTLTPLDDSDGWYQVEHNARTGWISGRYVMTSGDCA